MSRRAPTWLIEADVPGVDSQALQAAVRRQGLPVQVVKQRTNAPPPRDVLGSEALPLDACAVFLGTHPLMRHIQLHRRWRPGGWCNFDQLRCAHYYAFFGPWLLNDAYTLLPGVEAIRQAERLFAVHGADGRVFVRPDPVWKLFPGRCVTRAAFELALAPARYDPTTLVVVAPPQVVGREWRLIVAEGAIVAASQYADGTERRPAVAPGCPAEVRAFAEGILATVTWRPDPLFVLDVGECAGGLRVVELNAFSCSGLYACDLDAVVHAASEVARKLAGEAGNPG